VPDIVRDFIVLDSRSFSLDFVIQGIVPLVSNKVCDAEVNDAFKEGSDSTDGGEEGENVVVYVSCDLDFVVWDNVIVIFQREI